MRDQRRLELTQHMSITLHIAVLDSMDEIVEALASWQQDDVPVQLHPGDLGWNYSLGPQELAASLRVWRRDGDILAVGMADDDTGMIRMGLSPSIDTDDAFAAHLLADFSDSEQGVLPGEVQSVEARFGAALRDLLSRSGWAADESWAPLSRDLTRPVEDCGLRIEVIDPRDVQDQVLADRIAVGRVMFPNSTFTPERWRAMAAGPAYRRARCLVGYDRDDNAVAATTVWSAGERRAGLIEPLGVHPDHRGHGYGPAITMAASTALREMGSSSARVCTPSSNTGGVATYVAAGFEKLPDVTDFRRAR